MKKMKSLTAIVFVLTLSLITYSCADDGRDGRDGRDGFDGFDGRDGNANVQSDTYFVPTTEWDSTVVFGAEVNRINTKITADVLQTGLVQAYFSLDSNPANRRWIALPFFDFGYSYIEGGITFEYYDGIGSPDDLWYKVVIIPQAARLGGVDLNNYEEVKSVYGIMDKSGR